jgi:hypothetical protein
MVCLQILHAVGVVLIIEILGQLVRFAVNKTTVNRLSALSHVAFFLGQAAPIPFDARSAKISCV